MIHHCHAFGCSTPCQPEYLMCGRHWKMVPANLQRAVYATYVPGQCDSKPLPSRAWHEAADTAIAYVAVQERRWSIAQANAKLSAYGPRIWVGTVKNASQLRGPALFIPDTRVYIGREGYGKEASPLANPFAGDRDNAIAQYKGWLQEQMAPASPAFMELRRLLKLALTGGVVLDCFCVPMACHGDEVAAAIRACWEGGWRE